MVLTVLLPVLVRRLVHTFLVALLLTTVHPAGVRIPEPGTVSSMLAKFDESECSGETEPDEGRVLKVGTTNIFGFDAESAYDVFTG